MGTADSTPERATNVLIEASAGTGKTQTLAEHLIALLRAGLKPQEIVALTFSRAAAGEIFERFVTLLADRAASEPECARLLRDVVSTQHLSQIGTLDSFLMRIVRSFPLELGLRGSVGIMDDYRAGVERMRTSFAILRRTDPGTRRAFADAFALAMNREDVRSFVSAYRDFIRVWHDLVLAYPDEAAWGDSSAIWGVDAPDFLDWPGVAGAADRVAASSGEKALHDFADWVRGFRGSFGGVKGLAKKFLEKPDLFKGATIDVSFNRREYALGGEEAASVRAALRAVFATVLRMKLELARGVWTLISSFEREYSKRVRGKGRIVFSDVPRLIARLPESARLGLEYRMDARIRAWALDEFQDTSREQWRVLGPLIDEAKQSAGEKGVFIVGDRKQAIYGWRNGDVGIFTRERDGGAYAVGELKKTWRSGPAVVSTVNAIFVDGHLSDEFPGWSSPVHETARPELGGFVQRVEAKGSLKDGFVEPLLNAIKAVDPVRRGISAAILVRDNEFGEFLAAELRAHGIEGIVWEGESAIADTPALQGFLDLVALADHPGDKMAYSHFSSTPLARARFPEGVPPAEELSVRAARAFTTRGLVRVFRELRASLPDDPGKAWSAFTEGRFTDLLRAASEFELAMEPGVRLADFASFLAAKTKRNLAEPGRIKIMTIHRSKGLGFDWVLLPLYEKQKGIDSNKASVRLVGDGWVLPDPGSVVSSFTPVLSEAARDRKTRVEQEALCVWYVAVTRAKRALTFVTQPQTKTESSLHRFSDYVRSSIPEEMGDREWFKKGLEGRGGCPQPPAGLGGLECCPQPPAGSSGFVRRRRERVARRLPSESFRSGMSAGELFASRASRDAAKSRGTAAHAVFARIGWIDPASPSSVLESRILANDAWRDAFVKPSSDATLWRERSFELLADGEWTSGQFDRVVFSGSGDGRRAVIYDFKTNARRRGESDAGLLARLEADYAGQMAAYRRSLARLAGIPPERIETRILAAALLGPGAY